MSSIFNYYVNQILHLPFLDEESEMALNRERGDTEELMSSSKSKKRGPKSGHFHAKHNGHHLSTVEEEGENSEDSDASVVVYDTSRL